MSVLTEHYLTIHGGDLVRMFCCQFSLFHCWNNLIYGARHLVTTTF